MLKHFLLILPAIAFCNTLFSQNVGEVCFNLRPKEVIVRIDNKTIVDLSGLEQPYCMQLEAGSHTVEIWGSIFAIHSDTIEIKAGEKKTYIKGLQNLSKEFNAYRVELKSFHKKQISRTVAISSAILVNTLLTAYVVGTDNNVSQKRDKVLVAKTYYEAAVGELDIKNAKAEYERQNSEYEKNRKLFYTKIGVSVPLALGSYFFTYRLIKKLKATKPVSPEYHSTKPWSSLNLTIDAGWGFNGFKLTHNF